MNICVITLGDTNIKNYSKYSFVINEYYCSLHGYTYIQYNQSLDNSRPTAWSKIKAIQNHINIFDWICWIDADAIFFNHDMKIEDKIDQNYNLIISKATDQEWVDQHYQNQQNFLNINTGSFLIRGKNNWSNFLLEHIYSQTNRISHQWWENQALSDIYLQNNIFINSKIKILDQYALNGTEPELYLYKDFDFDQFILHYAGISNSDREYALNIRYKEFLEGKFLGPRKRERIEKI